MTHDLAECFELADEMLVVRGGRVVQSGPPRAVADRPANVEVARLLGISPIDVAVSLHRTRSRLQKEVRSLLGDKS